MVSLMQIVFILLLHSKPAVWHLHPIKSKRATVRELIALSEEAR